MKSETQPVLTKWSLRVQGAYSLLLFVAYLRPILMYVSDMLVLRSLCSAYIMLKACELFTHTLCPRWFRLRRDMYSNTLCMHEETSRQRKLIVTSRSSTVLAVSIECVPIERLGRPPDVSTHYPELSNGRN